MVDVGTLARDVAMKQLQDKLGAGICPPCGELKDRFEEVETCVEVLESVPCLLESGILILLLFLLIFI